jgi:hypothetical protein
MDSSLADQGKKAWLLQDFLQLSLANYTGVEVIAELESSNLNLKFPNCFTQCSLRVQALMLCRKNQCKQ